MRHLSFCNKIQFGKITKHDARYRGTKKIKYCRDIMILVFVSHLFLDGLFLFNLVDIPVFPATFAQFDRPRADVFSVQFFDRASEV